MTDHVRPNHLLMGPSESDSGISKPIRKADFHGSRRRGRKAPPLSRPYPAGRSMSQHVLHKNTIPAGAVVDKHMGNGSDELPVLENRASAHGCCQYRTTTFFNFFKEICHFSSVDSPDPIIRARSS